MQNTIGAVMTDVAVIHPNESAPMLPASNAITPSDMIARALERGASIETLEKLITLQERWEANEARKAYNEAMARAKAEIPPILKRGDIEHNGRHIAKYAKLPDALKAVEPILSKNGLSISYRTSSQNGEIIVACIVTHAMGHREETSLPGKPDTTGAKNAIQAVGSAVTYLQRYTLFAALGLAASEDDDGKASQTGTANPISADDAASLRAKMKAAGLAEARFCTVMKIEAVEDLPSSKYDEAERRIMDFSNAKRARDNAN
jgi:hypothetical protein